MKESLKKAQAKYQEKCKVYNLRINTVSEKDILNWMQEGKAATRIKKLIREDIQRQQGFPIILKDGATITEKITVETGIGTCFQYYYNNKFIFGVQKRFTKEELQRLYDNGYFDN